MKPWEKPSLTNQEGRWIVVVPIDLQTFRNYDITEDIKGLIWREQEPFREALVKILNTEIGMEWQNDRGPEGNAIRNAKAVLSQK